LKGQKGRAGARVKFFLSKILRGMDIGGVQTGRGLVERAGGVKVWTKGTRFGLSRSNGNESYSSVLHRKKNTNRGVRKKRRWYQVS